MLSLVSETSHYLHPTETWRARLLNIGREKESDPTRITNIFPCKRTVIIIAHSHQPMALVPPNFSATYVRTSPKYQKHLSTRIGWRNPKKITFTAK